MNEENQTQTKNQVSQIIINWTTSTIFWKQNWFLSRIGKNLVSKSRKEIQKGNCWSRWRSIYSSWCLPLPRHVLVEGFVPGVAKNINCYVYLLKTLNTNFFAYFNLLRFNCQADIIGTNSWCAHALQKLPTSNSNKGPSLSLIFVLIDWNKSSFPPKNAISTFWSWCRRSTNCWWNFIFQWILPS